MKKKDLESRHVGSRTATLQPSILEDRKKSCLDCHPSGSCKMSFYVALTAQFFFLSLSKTPPTPPDPMIAALQLLPLSLSQTCQTGKEVFQTSGCCGSDAADTAASNNFLYNTGEFTNAVRTQFNYDFSFLENEKGQYVHGTCNKYLQYEKRVAYEGWDQISLEVFNENIFGDVVYASDESRDRELVAGCAGCSATASYQDRYHRGEMVTWGNLYHDFNETYSIGTLVSREIVETLKFPTQLPVYKVTVKVRDSNIWAFSTKGGARIDPINAKMVADSIDFMNKTFGRPDVGVVRCGTLADIKLIDDHTLDFYVIDHPVDNRVDWIEALKTCNGCLIDAPFWMERVPDYDPIKAKAVPYDEIPKYGLAWTQHSPVTGMVKNYDYDRPMTIQNTFTCGGLAKDDDRFCFSETSMTSLPLPNLPATPLTVEYNMENCGGYCYSRLDRHLSGFRSIPTSTEQQRWDQYMLGNLDVTSVNFMSNERQEQFDAANALPGSTMYMYDYGADYDFGITIREFNSRPTSAFGDVVLRRAFAFCYYSYFRNHPDPLLEMFPGWRQPFWFPQASATTSNDPLSTGPWLPTELVNQARTMLSDAGYTWYTSDYGTVTLLNPSGDIVELMIANTDTAEFRSEGSPWAYEQEGVTSACTVLDIVCIQIWSVSSTDTNPDSVWDLTGSYYLSWPFRVSDVRNAASWTTLAGSAEANKSFVHHSTATVGETTNKTIKQVRDEHAVLLDRGDASENELEELQAQQLDNIADNMPYLLSPVLGRVELYANCMYDPTTPHRHTRWGRDHDAASSHHAWKYCIQSASRFRPTCAVTSLDDIASGHLHNTTGGLTLLLKSGGTRHLPPTLPEITAGNQGNCTEYKLTWTGSGPNSDELPIRSVTIETESGITFFSEIVTEITSESL